MKIHPVGAEFNVDRHDKITVTFRSMANAPKDGKCGPVGFVSIVLLLRMLR
jgi:hypothetical protein